MVRNRSGFSGTGRAPSPPRYNRPPSPPPRTRPGRPSPPPRTRPGKPSPPPRTRPDTNTRPGSVSPNSRRRNDDFKKDYDKPGTFSRVTKACTDNAALCLGAGLIGATVAKHGYEKYEELEKEQKQCINLCLPDDWFEYKDGEIDEPTYKTKDAVAPNDETVKYAPLYEDDETPAMLCTKDNLMKKGINSDKYGCDTFCKDVCEYDATDVVGGAVGDAADSIFNTVTGGVEDLFNSIFGDIGGMVQNAMLIGCAVCCCVILIFFAMKFQQ